MSTPRNSTKATATQNSGSLIMSIAVLLPLQYVGDRGLDRAAGRRRADQPLDDSRSGIDRDAAHVGHGGGHGLRDGLLGLGALWVESALQLLAIHFGLGLKLVPGFVFGRLGAVW